MITPGLERISRLLGETSLPWRAVHVAGTNGKGSVCHYIYNMLDKYNASPVRKQFKKPSLRFGLFTSPHLIHRWDSVKYPDSSPEKFLAAEAHWQKRNESLDIGASEFEILTATAFDLFNQSKVDVAVVETGMGGLLDSTNILGAPAVEQERAAPIAAAITKIGLDHQAFLGDSIDKIATQKAGILKSGMQYVIDRSNSPLALQAVSKYAASIGASEYAFGPAQNQNELLSWAVRGADWHKGSPHVRDNVVVALNTAWLTLEELGHFSNPDNLHIDQFAAKKMRLARYMAGVPHMVTIPGRQEDLVLRIKDFDGVPKDLGLMLDGAHNAQSAEPLSALVDRRRKPGWPAVWILAVSQGKDLEELLGTIVKPDDIVLATEFWPVDGMPWVKPVPADEISQAAERMGALTCSYGLDVISALRHAASLEKTNCYVAGSLYLVGTIHGLLENGKLQISKASKRPLKDKHKWEP